jgi:glyceraldehyde 3-phosphate dehydrogenase
MKIAINGFGRIGRAFFKIASQEGLEIVAVNDLGDIKNLAYLLKYDTAYGVNPSEVKVEGTDILVDGKRVKYISEKDGTKLPWKDLGIDLVVESTGLYTSAEKAQIHITAGAKRVVVTAPLKDEENATVKGATVIMGLNENDFALSNVTSNASCTTNAGAPLIAILHEKIGIEKALLNTVHAYTASQSIVDGPNKKDWREGRAAAQNLVPSSTGAAIATTKVVTDLAGKFDGIAIRVPVVTGSIVDITFVAKRDTSAEEVNSILRAAAAETRWSKTFSVTEEQLVSHDIIGSKYASIADLNFTRVVGGNLVKVLAWYDNEMGYAHALVEHVKAISKII